MISPEAITYAELPKIVDGHPLRGEDIHSMVRWAFGRQQHGKLLEQAASETGKSLEALWQEQPESLIGDNVDAPALNRFKPQEVYKISTDFGLRTAQLAAYNMRYKTKVEELGADLRQHLQSNDVSITATCSTGSYATGIYKLEDGGHVWCEKLPQATGRLIHINLLPGHLLIQDVSGNDYGLKIPSPYVDSSDMRMTLHYPNPDQNNTQV